VVDGGRGGYSSVVNYDGRVFRTVTNSSGGDVGEATTFRYRQNGDLVSATYAGGAVVLGSLLARADASGNLDMRYQHTLKDGSFKVGRCVSRPELLADGRLRVHERWRWTDGAEGEGTSIIEEIIEDISPTAEPRVAVFFYGSYINRKVLREAALAPEDWQVARLSGFDVRIAPRANLVRSAQDSVYGVLATATHRELERLYAHARDVLGEIYLPEAVLVEPLEGESTPALCYISPAMVPAPAELAYVDRIVGPAEELGFPGWYLDRLRSYRP
jgi:hypothetical protein